MVRVYPIYRSLAPSDHSDGFRSTMKVQVAELHTPTTVIQSPEMLLTCHSIQSTHPYGIFYGENPLNSSFTLLLLEIILVIAIIQILRFLLKPLKQPRIVAEIIGGIIIGPSVLGHNKKFYSCMFPDNTQYVLRNIGLIGFMYFVFVIGVKMDLSLVKKAGKKEMYIAFAGMVFPFIIVVLAAMIMRQSMDKDLAKFTSIGAISSSMAITSFPCIYTILEELNLLSSEVGRMSLSTSIICDAIGLNAFYAFEAAKQGETKPMAALWYLISLAVLVAFCVIFVGRGMQWIVDHTPEGDPVDQGYVVAILLLVLVMGFLTDFFGVAIATGPMMLGLVIPDGPPLGSTLVARCETLIFEFLMPIAFIFIGITTDVYSMTAVGWVHLSPLFALALIGYFSKVLVTAMAAVFVNVPLRESFAMSFILSLRGQVEILLYLHWMDKVIIDQPGFSLLILLTAAVTGTCTALISILYDPTKPYMVNKRRTIQHTSPENEVRIVLCMHDLESVHGLIKLVEVSNPTVTSPFSIFALHLIELVGRAAPLFIDHEEQKLPSKYGSSEAVLGALKLYQESQNAYLNLRTFTAVSPKKTMFQDICKLALECKATLVILPFHKEHLDIGGAEVVLAGVRSVNSNVLAHAPCSVGILVDKGNFQRAVPAISTENSAHHFVLLFLGGADAREALVFADRMAGNRSISLTVIRFLSYNFNGDNEMEKKLDDGLVTWFWVKNEKNDRVVYREVVVRDGDETIAAIEAMNDESYDLWIVGRKHGINPVLLEGLTKWNKNQELGVIGDYLTSVDFGSSASVLVMQQQIMRSNVETAPCSLGIFPCNSC